MSTYTANPQFIVTWLLYTVTCVLRKGKWGIPWWPSGWDSELSLPRTWVQSLVGELRSHHPNGTVLKNQNKQAKKKKIFIKEKGNSF